MIGSIRGQITVKKPPFLMVEVSGIGYEIHASMLTFYNIPDIGSEVFLHTHLVVREDAHLLYGFHQEQERTLFRTLIKVSNVGPKLALAILSGIEPEAFVRCILDQDIHTLVRVPGVGKKTAERLVVEMRDRLHDWDEHSLPQQDLDPGFIGVSNNTIIKDAVSALVALGFKSQDASRVISKVKEDYSTREELIRLALQSTLKGDKNDHNGSPN